MKLGLAVESTNDSHSNPSPEPATHRDECKYTNEASQPFSPADDENSPRHEDLDWGGYQNLNRVRTLEGGIDRAYCHYWICVNGRLSPPSE